MKRAALFTVMLAHAFPLTAFAQVTPDRAASLESQIKAWLQSTLGDVVTVDRAPVTITAEGDHYKVSAPLGKGSDAPVMTGRMTDAGGGRWAIDDVAIPSPSTFRYQLPASGKPGARGGEAVSTVTIGRQQQRMLIDPSFATPSTISSTFGQLDLATQIPGSTQLSHIESGTSNSTLTPAADGRVNVATDTAVQGYTIKMSGAEVKQPVSLRMGNVSVVSTFAGVSRERSLEIVRLLTRATTPDKNSTDKAPSLSREASLALLSAIADWATSGTIDEKVDDLTVTIQDMTGSLKQVALGLVSKLDDGKLQAQMPLSAEGLTLPEMGLGTLTQLIPTKLALTPTVSGVPSAAVMQMAKKLIDKQEPNEQDIGALFRQGPINAGIDNFHLDVAGSSFAGNVKMLVSSRSTFSGTGQVTAENLDRLQQTMAGNPQTAQMAPLLIFMKGIGRVEQSRLVWDLAYRDGQLLVNGQDMGALMGAPPPSPRPAPARPQRPAPTRP